MAYNYGKYGIFVIKREECSVCKGSGQIGEDPFEECPNCNGGHGYIETEIPLQDALREIGIFIFATNLSPTNEQIDNLVKCMNDIFVQHLNGSHQSAMRRVVRDWLAALSPSAPVAEKKE